jgi:ribosomal protein S18 acetylase RimI-like enzyme
VTGSPVPAKFPAFQRALRGMRLFFDTWYPWEQKKIAPRVQPVHFRKIREDDYEWCERLHRRNQHHGVPAQTFDDFSGYLRSSENLVLIGEKGSERVVTFGVRWWDDETVFMSYLMVDPGVHRTGVGTTAVLAALSLMKGAKDQRRLLLSAVDTSINFYRKLGFQTLGAGEEDGLRGITAALGALPPLLIHDCGRMVARAGGSVENVTREIPVGPPKKRKPQPNPLRGIFR